MLIVLFDPLRYTTILEKDPEPCVNTMVYVNGLCNHQCRSLQGFCDQSLQVLRGESITCREAPRLAKSSVVPKFPNLLKVSKADLARQGGNTGVRVKLLTM